MQVVDHDDPQFAAKYRANRRENGSVTYSRQIAGTHLPFWRELTRGRSAIASTCPLLLGGRGGEMDLTIQYLHRYPYGPEPLIDVERVLSGRRPEKTLFVVAYRPLRDRILARGWNAVWVPMTIDSAAVRACSEGAKLRPSRIAYFGNLRHGKEAAFPRLRAELERAGYQVDVFAESLSPTGRRLTQKETWRDLSRYRAGAAVGRCALELYALGIPVLIAGSQFGGVVTCPEEFAVQSSVNFNGRVTTYDRDVSACLARLPSSYVPEELPTPESALPDPNDPAILRWLG